MTGRLPQFAVLVVVTDAVLLATGVIRPAAALALFLVVEVPLGALAVASYLRQYRAHRRTMPRRHALAALTESDPMLRIARTEISTIAAVAHWVTRRPDVPDGARPIGYWRGTLAVPLALATVCLIELVALHLLVPWPIGRLIVDLISLYSLLAVAGMLASRIVRPHLLTADTLVLRQGTHVCATIPLKTVATARPDRRLSPTSPEISDQATLALPGPDGTCLTITLNRDVCASVATWPWARPTPRPVNRIYLHVNDPHTTAALLEPVKT